MNVGTIVMLILFTVVLGYGIAIYNGLVTLKHNVLKAWANIDVLLKQRHDELPKLVEICRQYMQHEQDTLVQVSAARISATMWLRWGPAKAPYAKVSVSFTRWRKVIQS